MPKLLGIDYGKKRTGIAETDDLQIVASGLTTVETGRLMDFLEDYLQNQVENSHWREFTLEGNTSVEKITGFWNHFQNFGIESLRRRRLIVQMVWA